jgi:hypothetical protein
LKAKGKTPREVLRPKRRTLKPTAPVTYAAWKAAAVAQLGGKPGTLPEREWKRMFIAGTDVDKAARHAQLYRESLSAATRSR